MKRLGFGVALFFFATLSFAQVKDTTDYFPPPPTDNNSGVASVLRSQRHLLFVDITQNTWLQLPNGITTKFISGGVNFSLYYDIFIAKKFFGVAPGISFSNATVKNNAFLANIGGGPNLYAYPDSVHYLRNKFSISYFDVPIELRFRIKPDERGKNFWFAPGFRAGVLLSDFWKYKYDANGTTFKTKTYYQQGIEGFHYGVTLRAGYYKFGVYAFYSLTSLFEKNKGPGLVPFSVGIALTPL